MLVIGGGDSAVDWVLNLLPLAQSVTLIHRRDSFRAHEDSLAKMRASAATIKVFYELEAIMGTDGVQGVRISTAKHRKERSWRLI